MLVIVPDDSLAIIRVNPGGGDHWPAEIATHILDDILSGHVTLQVLFSFIIYEGLGIDIETVLMMFITGNFLLLKRRTDRKT